MHGTVHISKRRIGRWDRGKTASGHCWQAGFTGCILAACLASVLGTPAVAQGPGGAAPAATPAAAAPEITLQQAIDEALRAAPSLLAAGHDTAAANRKTQAAGGLRYGELDTVATAQRLNDAQLLRPMSGPLTPATMATVPFAENQMHIGVVYTYPLYDGNRIANQIRIAELGAERSRALLVGTRSDVVYNVTALYAQAQALGAQANAVQQEIDELNTTRRNLELSVRIGKQPEVDLLKVIDRIREAEALRDSTLAQQKRLLADLLAVIGRDPAQAIALAPLPDQLPAMAAGQEGLAAAALQRSSVEAAKLAAAQSERQVALARGAQDPDVALQGSYLRHADLTDVGNSQETWFVGLQFSFPLFDGGTRRAEVAKSREETAAARERATQAKLQAAADLQSALAQWQSAQQQLTAANAQYDAAHEVVRIEQLRFDLGAGDIEDLLRARTRDVEAQSAQIAGRANITVSAAQINHVTEEEAVR